MARRKGCCGCVPVLLIFMGALAVAGYYAYKYVLKDNVNSENLETELLIPTGAGFEEVLDSMQAKNLLIHEASFRQVAKAKKYPELVKSGRYLIQNNWNNIELVDYLRRGQQAPVQFIINNARTREDLAGKVGNKFELDSLEVLNSLNSSELSRSYGFTRENFPVMFLANTYEMYWNATSDEFFDRMKTEYDRFWTEARKAKANALGLSSEEVIILASIVEEETKVAVELPIVAGLYLNRLEKGMKLEADPTVKYAIGDFAIRRVLNKHLENPSPYNTYQHVGLPPGPIRIPELNVIDAVLNPTDHEYLYMCASHDFDGTHEFATNLADHNRNARRYRDALNEREIYN